MHGIIPYFVFPPSRRERSAERWFNSAVYGTSQNKIDLRGNQIVEECQTKVYGEESLGSVVGIPGSARTMF